MIELAPFNIPFDWSNIQLTTPKMKKIFYYLNGLAGMQTTITNPDWGGGSNLGDISNWAFYEEGGTSVPDA